MKKTIEFSRYMCYNEDEILYTLISS